MSQKSQVTNSGPNLRLRQYYSGLGFVVVLQAILLVIAGKNNWPLLNSDAIAYMRLAEHYAAGRADLMISGYWGPLISWLMAPWLWLGLESLTAARIVMGCSGLAFLASTVFLLTRLGISPGQRLCGAIVAAITGIVWSVTEITPDLLLASLLTMAAGSMISIQWLESRQGPWQAGVWMALAYTCKAVGMPIALGCCGGFGFLWWLTQPAQHRCVLKQLLRTVLIFGLLAGLWISVISLKYQRLVFSTSARIGHAVVGPNDLDRSQAFALQFHQPPPGRLTSWEDPSNLPYQYWSPWERSDYLRHQVSLIGRNVMVARHRLAELDLIGIDQLVLVVGWVFLLGQCVSAVRRTPEASRVSYWPWTVVPVCCLVGTYLPVYAAEARFYYPCFPLLLASGLGALDELGIRRPDLSRLKNLLTGLVLMCFAGPGIIQFYPALAGFKDPAVIYAWDLAARIEKAGLRGPIAGSGMIEGQRVGLYVAYILRRPWYGDERHPTPETFLKSGAEVMVFNRLDSSSAGFLTHPAIRDLDPELFADRAGNDLYPLKLFKPAQPVVLPGANPP